MTLQPSQSPQASVDRDWEFLHRTLSQRQYPRMQLVNLLQQQAQQWGSSQPVLENIEKLRASETVVVTTGQQVGIFGGPAYTLYKALGAVKLASSLEAQGIPAVPIFWMATQDHDLDEVQRIHLIHDRLVPQQFELGLTAERCPVGLMHLGESVETLLNAIERSFCSASRALPYGREVLAVLREFYRADSTFAEGFARWLSYLTGSLGLIILDPAVREFAALACELTRHELFGSVRSQSALTRSRQRLDMQGYSEVVPTNRDVLQLFVIDANGNRQRLQKRERGFTLQQSQDFLTHDTVQELLAREPERFSPSALLRPIYQDAVLPTIAYVAGPTERKYFAQLPEVYTWAEIPMPQIVARPSFVVQSSRIADQLAAVGGITALLNADNAIAQIGLLGLPKAVQESYRELVALHVQSTELRHQALLGQAVGQAAIALQSAIEQWLVKTELNLETWLASAQRTNLTQLMSQISQLVVVVTFDLSRSGGKGILPATRNLTRLIHTLDRTEQSLSREGRKQNAEQINTFAYIKPKNSSQDRHLGVAELIATYGFSVVSYLQSIADIDLLESQLVTIH